ncbi:hypothetical protein [Umezawaea beigongshangensis]|uniref:hypothetical protein n=1 Tax=Umezawaea beigongshangensis TaxID=2780383 RepID=UPI0018F22E35|nr:hypothetical protein [Umezawaea beigongshangensis]
MKKSKGLLGLVGPVVSTVSAVSTLRAARGDKDKLALVNALAGFLLAVTGIALTVREARKDGIR